MTYQPPFELNNEIIELIAGIAQNVGRIEGHGNLNPSPQLRKDSRIRTIHSSLAIENNTLSLEQVTAVVEGKHVVAPPRDLLEVQNALAAYEALDSFSSTSPDDLLRAHRLLMAGLTSEAGMYRHGDVGIFNGENLVHAGTPAAYVPEVMANLFSWLSETTIHPLVASCVFHYELEFIHPFQDGNGRTGRLWQTLILSEWNELFAWLPVESLVKEHQEEYYASLGVADVNADSTAFVQFMLSMISAALDEVVESQQHDGINDGINNGITDNNSSKSEEMREQLLSLVRTSPTITIAQMADELGVGKRQAERLVASLKAEGRLVRLGAKRNGRWEAR
ncbi:Fic family protein [uncultured Enorma sp.]|uniref:Fic family protein n=1 Tax=uncultured Enorma sp. TaxID=1714346 RepID=UPI0026DC6098|nr:Fic family protein [uncultured Enorma sp.]